MKKFGIDSLCLHKGKVTISVLKMVFISFVSLMLFACSEYSQPQLMQPQVVKPSYVYGDMAIMGRGKANVWQLENFFILNNPKINRYYLDKLAKTYVEEANREGVNSDVAFCQMCVETNFLRFGNQVKADQNNFSGLGATDNGDRGYKFKTMIDGVKAQIQHLKAYASTQQLYGRNIDPRFYMVKRGSARYVSQLGNGKWASDPYYASKIMRMINSLYKVNAIS